MKSRTIEASIKTERAVIQLTRFRESQDVGNRTNYVMRDFDRVKPNKNEVEEDRE